MSRCGIFEKDLGRREGNEAEREGAMRGVTCSAWMKAKFTVWQFSTGHSRLEHF